MLNRVGSLFAIKKPSEVDEVQSGPETEDAQVVLATGAHHGEKAPEGKSRKTEPEHNPVESEEAKEAERGRRNKTADLGSIDRVEVKILDFRPDERAFPQGLVQTTLYKAGVDASEVDKVEIKTGLGSCGDNEQGNKCQRHRAVPKKADNHENEKKVETMEELFVVGVLHLSHPTELIHPEIDLLSRFFHHEIMGRSAD